MEHLSKAKKHICKALEATERGEEGARRGSARMSRRYDEHPMSRFADWEDDED